MYTVNLYRRVRWAHFVEGMSTREAARVFGLHRSTVNKMLEYSVPPGYRREQSPRRPKLDPYKGVIDRILEVLATSKSGTLLLRRDQGDVAALPDSRRCWL